MRYLLRNLLFALCCLTLSFQSYSQATLTGAEYFWNTDPGVGAAIALTSQDGNYNEAIETAFSNGPTLPGTAGLQSFNVRFRDFAGNWGPVYTRTIVTQPNPRNIKITAGEFFWDNDPGEGNATVLLAFDGAYDEALETVFKSSLTLPNTGGLHVFHVRLKDENGEWGPLYKRVIALQDSPRNIKITAAEYFWGTNDPGLGSGTALLAFDGAYDEALETVVQNTLGLPNTAGLNLFNIRIKDENGNWGPTYKRVIALQDNPRNIKITAAEYFWGTTDPGPGAGTALLAFDGAYDEALETVFQNAAPLPGLNGIQLFNVRVKDENGQWGPLYKRTIALQDAPRNIKITAAEYFWGTSDPGLGSGTTLLAFDGAFNEALETVVQASMPIPSLQGLQLFNIRVRDENGTWGPTYKRTISIQDALRNIKITAAEYFWGTVDPGDGAGTAMLCFDGAFNEALETAFTSGISSPGVGLNLFNVRLRDENNEWGPIYKRTVYIETPGNSLPIQITSSNGSSTLCQGGSVQLTASGASTYTWSPTSGLSATTGATVTANPTGTITYTVTGTDLLGNTGTANITLTVVNSSVIPSISIAASQTTICSGTTQVVYTATATNGGTNPSYQWFKNGVSTGTNSSTFTLNSPAANDAIYCVLTSNASCASPTIATSNTITLSFSTTTVAPGISITASQSTICAATTQVVYTATETNGGTNPSYQWFKNGLAVGTSSSSFTLTSPTSGDAVHCVLTSNASCASPTTAASNTITLSFSATTIAPSISISASQSTICAATTQVIYTASATNGGTNPSFQWYKNGVAVGANSSTYVLTSPVSGDEVNCVLTSNGSCLSAPNATSNTITLSFSASTVIPSVTISSSPGASCLATAVTFTATPTNGGTNPQYVWRKNGNLVGNNSNSYSDPSIASSDVISVDLQSNASCVSGGASASNSVSIGNVLTWTGAVDDDWHKPCNWNFNQVPQCCNSVIIPATSRNPIITGIAAANDITIHTTNGALVTVANGANLQVQDCPITITIVGCP